MTAKVNVNDLWTMYINTVRHTLVSNQHAAAGCVEMYHRYKGHFSLSQCSQVAHEVQREICRAEAAGETLGTRADHLSWLRLVSDINGEPV